MHGSKIKTAYNEQIRDEATEWLIQFCEDEVDARARREFDAWLRASPQHVRAFLDISALWESAGTLGRVNKVSLEELVRRARAEGNIVPLESVRRPTERSAGKFLLGQFLRHRSYAFAAALLVVCLIAAPVTWWYLARYPTYMTRIGERRAVTLADGSTVEMNVRTRIEVRFNDSLRTVDLIEGQALFRVAKDAKRPFVVKIGNTSVRAVGTEFDVYSKPTGTVVTVVEGRVAVSTPDASAGTATSPGPVQGPAPVLIGAGEQLTVTARRAAAPLRANTARVTAWTEGKLEFDSTSLGEVVQEFNRYNARPLAIDDAELLSLHISGTFATSESAQIVTFLAQRFNLVVRETPEGIHLTRQ